jgi:hypothetical protein
MAVSPDFIDRRSCLKWRSIKLEVSPILKLIPNDMTQANEPNDSQREINRRFRDLSWRVERLETSQMPARSLNESFDRVYDEIDALENQINARFDRLEVEVRDMRAEMNGKFDTIMRHLTGLGDR